MVTAKLVLSTGTGDLDHFFAVGNGQAAMTIDTSAALGTIAQIFAAGQFKDVKLGVGPMPGPDSPDGGVLVGGAAKLHREQVVAREAGRRVPIREVPRVAEVQSEWAAATGYVPVSKTAVTMSPLEEWYVAAPRVQGRVRPTHAGPVNEATAGPVIGPYGAKEGVRGAIIDAVQSMITNGTSAKQAIDNAAKNSNTAIEDYNSRF